MDNIVIENNKRKRLFKIIGYGGLYFVRIVGCSVIDSCGYTFGWTFVIIGVLIDYVATRLKDKHSENGGALTLRKLSDDDLRGLNKEELDLLICQIYAIHGYDFNVNDGLFYLPKLWSNLCVLFPDRMIKINSSELCYYSSKLGCSISQLVTILEASEDVAPGSPTRVPIELFDEGKRNMFRKKTRKNF